jgi:type I restriction enzyme S subunit
MSDLPAGWAEAVLRDIADTSSGGTPSRAKQEYYGGSNSVG